MKTNFSYFNLYFNSHHFHLHLHLLLLLHHHLHDDQAYLVKNFDFIDNLIDVIREFENKEFNVTVLCQQIFKIKSFKVNKINRAL